MWDEAELSDEDLRAIYGEAALLTRLSVTVARLEEKSAHERQRRTPHELERRGRPPGGSL